MLGMGRGKICLVVLRSTEEREGIYLKAALLQLSLLCSVDILYIQHFIQTHFLQL